MHNVLILVIYKKIRFASALFSFTWGSGKKASGLGLLTLLSECLTTGRLSLACGLSDRQQ